MIAMRPLPALGTVLVMAVVCAPAARGADAAPRVMAGAPQAVLVPPGPLRIVALGDSLTSGHRLSRDEAYPAVLQETMTAAGLPAEVINHGVSGDTTAEALRRLDDALREEPHVLIVALGANDGLRGVPVRRVQSNLEQIVTTALERGVQVLLVGMEALPIHGLQYTLDFHQVYPALAAAHDLPLVPFMLSGVFGNPELMGQDQIHPNAAGARVIAANIWVHLQPLVQSMTAAR